MAIIGGGIASALVALALLRRGARVTLHCADDQPAQGASGNRQGAFYPLLNHRHDALAQFLPPPFLSHCAAIINWRRNRGCKHTIAGD